MQYMDGTERYRDAEHALWRRYEVEPRERDVELGDAPHRLRIVEVGPADGNPVMFIPGTGGTGPYWAPLFQQLPDLRCLAMDRPGWGLSDPLDYGRDTFASVTSETLLKVLDALDLDRVDIVGASIGALWALHLARLDPARVRRVVVIGGVPHSEFGVPQFIKLLASPAGEFIVSTPMPPEALKSELEAIGHGASVADGRMDDFMAWRLSFTNDTPSMRNERDMVRALLAGEEWRAGFTMDARDLADVAQPVRMIFGENDPTGTPDLWRRFTDQMPNGDLVVVPNAGHLPWWDEPAEVSDLVRRFLTQ